MNQLVTFFLCENTTGMFTINNNVYVCIMGIKKNVIC